MGSGRAGTERVLFEEFASRLTAALEGMAGSHPAVSWDPLPSAPQNATLRWRQPMTSLPGAVWVLAAEPDWSAAGRVVLQAAGIDEAEASDCKSTYFEVSNQALAGLAQFLTARAGREVTPNGGEESAQAPASARWAEVHVKLGDASFAIAVGLEDALLEAVPDPERRAAAASTGAEETRITTAASASEAPAAPPSGGSKTFDLLLDVELPVSVSFGRTRIPLKDVLKLSTGSIVELNRNVNEPVEIIVNNCVIARGEVVVVEGNFGVRIQEVISRQERLRTLQ